MRATIKFLVIILSCLLLSSCASFSLFEQPFGERPDVQAFIQRISVKDGFNPQQLTALFNQVHISHPALSSISKPHEFYTPWPVYRAIFLTPERAQQGAAFWKAHEETLEDAQRIYGVPPQMIVAILGVETRYGRLDGKYRVLDALSSLAFNYPRRAHFFQNELEQYLLLTRDAGLDPATLTGSYAGAVGEPQFMPDSYRRFAVAANGGKYADLWHNDADVILSVANYFKSSGWQRGQPVAVRAIVTNTNYLQLNTTSLAPDYTVGQLAHYGVFPVQHLAATQRVNFMIFETETGPEYWLGLPNFHTITRYNASAFYAMAAYQLGEAILLEMNNS